MYKDIKTVEDAYKATEQTAPEITGENAELLTNINHLVVVSKAIREGWTPDYNNSDWKWYPWFDLETEENNPSGFRFSDSVFTDTRTSAALGPLLCQESEKKADYFGKQFEDLFRKVMKPA